MGGNVRLTDKTAVIRFCNRRILLQCSLPELPLSSLLCNGAFTVLQRVAVQRWLEWRWVLLSVCVGVLIHNGIHCCVQNIHSNSLDLDKENISFLDT